MAKDVIDVIAIARECKYPLDAFLFVQQGLTYTVGQIYGETEPTVGAAGKDAPPSSQQKAIQITGQQPAPAAGEAAGKPVERHVTGRQLCIGLRDFAIDQYGLLARTVLRRWRINSCEDFGHIVYAMVDAGIWNKTDEDTLRDFMDVYDFETAFAPQLELSKKR